MNSNMKLRVLFFIIPALLLSGCGEFSSVNDDEKDKEYILLKVNNYNGLLQLYRDRLQKKEDPKTRYKVAEYYHLLTDYESSRHFLAPLLDSQPTTEVYLLESKNLLELGKKDEALIIIDKALIKDPNNGELHNIKGVVLAEMGYFDESIKSFGLARGRLLADNVVMNNIAMVYILKEDYKSALGYLIPIYQRGEKSPKLVHNLVLSLIKTGDYIQAEKVIQDENIPETLEQLIYALDDIKVAVKENTNTLPNHSLTGNSLARNNKNGQQTKNGASVPANVVSKETSDLSQKPKEVTLVPADSNKNVLDTNKTSSSVQPTTSAQIKSSDNQANILAVSTPLASPETTSALATTNATATTTTSAPAVTENTPATGVSATNATNVTQANVGLVNATQTSAAPNTSTDTISKNDSSSSPVITPSKSTESVSVDKSTITDVRMADSNKGTRFVIESTKEIKFKVLTNAGNGNELSVEMMSFNPSDKLTNTNRYLRKNHKTIESISFTASGEDKTIMTFKFKKNLSAKVYHMGPDKHYKDRIVIDIAN